MPCGSTDKNMKARRRHRLRWTSMKAFTIAAALAVSVSACSTAGQGGGAGEQPATKLTVGFSQEPADWNYLRNSSTAIRSLLFYNVVEPLIEEKEDGSFAPLLAESYQADPDGKNYTFKLRDASFHNGAKMTADDVIYSVNAAKSSTLSTISGPLAVLQRINKVDDRTVQFVLKSPSQTFLDNLAKNVPIIPQGSADSFGKKPIGTGPFVFSDWQHGVRVSLTSYQGYWGAKPAIHDVVWRFITDRTAALNALLAHDIDLLPAVQSKQTVQKAEKTPGVAVSPMSGSEIGYLTVNAKDPKFQDPRVRQAIAYAVDRNALAQGVETLATPTCVMVNPPNVAWKSSYCPYPYDPARARQLLAAAGAQGLTIRFPFIGTSYSTWMQILSQQLKDVGVTLQPESLDLATYIDRVFNKADYEATVISGPQQIDSWRCPGFFTGACLKQVDDLLTQADTAVDRGQWANLRRKAVELDADQSFLIPLATISQDNLHNSQLAGFKSYSVASEIDLRSVHWTQK